jgi:hypothetical protein
LTVVSGLGLGLRHYFFIAEVITFCVAAAVEVEIVEGGWRLALNSLGGGFTTTKYLQV